MRGHKLLDHSGIVYGIVAPLAEIGSAVDVAQHTERGIRTQPVAVDTAEFPERFAVECVTALFGKNFAHVFVFGVVDTLVLHRGTCVELAAKVFVVLHTSFVAKTSELLQTHIHGMKRESRAGVVGVRVGPRMGHRGIVDREYLKELLPCSHCPVDHLHKVEEIAHTEILLCAHGECRYGHTGATPCRTGVDHTLSAHHQGIMLVGGHNVHHSVVATLPGLQFMSGAVENHKLVSEGQRHLTQVDAYRPAGEIMVIHYKGTGRIPGAKRLVIAAYGHYFIGSHHRGLDIDSDSPAGDGQQQVAVVAAVHALGKYRGII